MIEPIHTSGAALPARPCRQAAKAGGWSVEKLASVQRIIPDVSTESGAIAHRD